MSQLFGLSKIGTSLIVTFQLNLRKSHQSVCFCISRIDFQGILQHRYCFFITVDADIYDSQFGTDGSLF